MPDQASKDCVVYCRWWCGDCMLARLWLDHMGYEYTEIDIEDHPQYAERVRKVAGKVVTPTFEIGDKVIVGFDRDAVADALGPAPALKR